VAAGADRDPKVQEDETVDVAVSGPAQGPPLVEAAEECIPCEAVVGLR
jgi:hypothetical protein